MIRTHMIGGKESGRWGGVTWKIQNIEKNYTNMERVKTKSTNRNTNNKKKTNYKHKYFSVALDTVCIDS